MAKGKKSSKAKKIYRYMKKVAKYRRPQAKGTGMSTFLTALNIPLTVLDHQGEAGRPDWEFMRGNYENAIRAFRYNIGYTFGSIAGLKQAFVPFLVVQGAKRIVGNARLTKFGKYQINVL